ncbi:MAG: hypothetical protein HKN76_09195 [Saprospiraceae bacterium]|nr:hypothetical protein [Saprospiraceae bacterium]
MKISRLVILYLMSLVCTGLQSQNNMLHDGNAPARIDMWEEPRHQLVLSKDQLKIMDVRIPPGDTSQFHQHRFATIYIVINDALMWGQVYGKDWKSSRTKRRAKYTISDRSMSYFENHVFHRVCNPDTTTMHLIALLSTKQPSQEVFDQEKGVNNRWFRETRLQLDPQAKSQVFEFSFPVVIVQCTSGESAVLQNKVMHSTKTEGGAFSWHEANVPFTIVNKSDNTQEFVLVEIK